MKNTGKPYEQLTEQVFTRLLAHGGHVCANVRRDIILQGKSTKHQIDVYFDFMAGPALYQTLVQCKDWGAPVKQEQVLAFHDVLNDIPGQPRGIMVARSGFQEGAHNVARHHGIELYELREPRDEDWTGLPTRMVTHLNHLVGRDARRRTLRKIVADLRRQYPAFKPYDFPNIDRMLQANGVRSLV